MTTLININGKINLDTSVSVFDHGFLFGDSVYEVIGTRNSVPFLLKEHLNRLHQSAEAIKIVIPFDNKWFSNEINRTLKETENPESYIRIVITRGIGELDIDPSSCHSPCVLIFVTSARIYPSEYYEKGVNLAIVNIKRNYKLSLDPGIKTGNYLNNVLAKIEANKLDAHDALMLNPFGQIAESTTSNIFFVKDGRLMTPSLSCGILSGITRNIIIKIAKENGFLVEEGEWPVEIIEKSDEIFLTGTIKKLMPVTRVDRIIIGDGKPGSMTRSMMYLYEEFLESLDY